MKTLLAVLLFISLSVKLLAAPTLSASSIQPGYPATTKPFLNIISGSGKTSYIGCTIDDPTDPLALYGINFTVSNPTAVISVTSSKTTVVNVSGINISNTNGNIVVTIKPSEAGYTDIKLSAKDASGTSGSYTLKLAVSAASSNPKKTIWPTYIADASGVAAVDDDYMFVADDETNILRLYNRKMSGKDLYQTDISSALGVTEECDLEGASTGIKYNKDKRIYWIGSLGNSKSGNLKPDRNRIIATDIIGTGANSTLKIKSYSDKIRPALISWGNNHSWNFTASAAEGKIPKLLDGFNVEGLTITHGGDTGYIGLRAPCVPVKGTTPNTANRKYAVLAPVTNFEEILNVDSSSSKTPQFGEAILFDFEGLGIRSIEKVGTNQYIIIAGLYTGGGIPAVYLWDGKVPENPASNPVTVNSSFSKLKKLNLNGLEQLSQIADNGDAEGHPEAVLADIVNDILNIHIVCDNGTVDYYKDGKEAKELSKDEFKKFRYDNFEYDLKDYSTICTNEIVRYRLPDNNGSNFQWQVNTGTGYQNIEDHNIYSGTHSSELVLNKPPTYTTGYQYRCIYLENGNGKISEEFMLSFKAYWIGSVNNLWEVAGNWSCNVVPDRYTDVYIERGNPVLNNHTAIKSLNLKNEANLKISANIRLDLLQ